MVMFKNRVKMSLDVLPSVRLKDHGVKDEREVDSVGVRDNEDDDGDGLLIPMEDDHGQWKWLIMGS